MATIVFLAYIVDGSKLVRTPSERAGIRPSRLPIFTMTRGKMDHSTLYSKSRSRFALVAARRYPPVFREAMVLRYQPKTATSLRASGGWCLFSGLY
jgi:hypothetical protein